MAILKETGLSPPVFSFRSDNTLSLSSAVTVILGILCKFWAVCLKVSLSIQACPANSSLFIRNSESTTKHRPMKSLHRSDTSFNLPIYTAGLICPLNSGCFPVSITSRVTPRPQISPALLLTSLELLSGGM